MQTWSEVQTLAKLVAAVLAGQPVRQVSEPPSVRIVETGGFLGFGRRKREAHIPGPVAVSGWVVLDLAALTERLTVGEGRPPSISETYGAVWLSSKGDLTLVESAEHFGPGHCAPLSEADARKYAGERRWERYSETIGGMIHENNQAFFTPVPGAPFCGLVDGLRALQPS